MEQSIAAASFWALVLLCVALYRSGQWRVAIPIADEAPDASPIAPSSDEDEAARPDEAGRRRFPVAALPGVVMATAAVRLSLLVALGR